MTNTDGDNKNDISKDKPKRMETFKRLINLSKPEGSRIAIGLTALSINSITNLSFPWLMGKAVDRVTDNEPENLHIFLSGTAGIILVGSIASWVRVYCLGTASDLISARLRKQLFDSYMDKDMNFYDSARSGELITILGIYLSI
jgi:ABC-type multidrug transport system fused ATPase/permease subunit